MGKDLELQLGDRVVDQDAQGPGFNLQHTKIKTRKELLLNECAVFSLVFEFYK